MNKLIAALIAAVFAFGSGAALAQGQPDRTPSQPVDAAALKEQRIEAQAGYAKMSPAEKAAFKKGRAAQRQMDLAEQGALGTSNPPTTPEEQKAINAQKSQPKALQTPAQRQDALKQQEKEAVKGGGG